MPGWNDILCVIKASADWFQQHYAAVIAVLALLGIGIDKTPWIKVNPIKSLVNKIGERVGNYLNGVFKDSVAELNSKIDEQTRRIEKLENDMLQDKNDEIEDKIYDMRWKILDFANGQEDRDYDIEMYAHIKDVYDRYEKIIDEKGMTNGRVDVAYAKICKKRKEKIGY